MGRKSRLMYMQVTNDKFELPISYPMTLREMASFLGVRVQTVFSLVYGHERYGKHYNMGRNWTIVKVDISSDVL